MPSTLIDTLTELSQAQVEVEKAWAAYRRAAEEAHYAAAQMRQLAKHFMALRLGQTAHLGPSENDDFCHGHHVTFLHGGLMYLALEPNDQHRTPFFATGRLCGRSWQWRDGPSTAKVFGVGLAVGS